MDNKTFLTPKELAARWKLSPGTLSNWRYHGKGPHYIKIEGSVLYDLADIVKYEKMYAEKLEEPETETLH